MSHPIPATLYRIAAVAGGGSAIILLINAAKRAEVIPTSAFTQLVAPLAQILALALVTALYSRLRAPSRHLGPGRLWAERVLAGGAGRRGVRHQSRFRRSSGPHRSRHSGPAPLGVALTVASISFLLGTLGFVAAMLRSREVPTAPLVLYAVGVVPVSLRAFVPEVALDLGLVTLAVGISWLAVWLFHRSSRITTWANPAIAQEG